MESVIDGMESRTKGKEKYSLTTDAIRGKAAIPYTLKRDAIPSPSVLDKKSKSIDLDFLVELTGVEPVSKNLLTQPSPWAVGLLRIPLIERRATGSHFG